MNNKHQVGNIRNLIKEARRGFPSKPNPPKKPKKPIYPGQGVGRGSLDITPEGEKSLKDAAKKQQDEIEKRNAEEGKRRSDSSVSYRTIDDVRDLIKDHTSSKQAIRDRKKKWGKPGSGKQLARNILRSDVKTDKSHPRGEYVKKPNGGRVWVAANWGRFKDMEPDEQTKALNDGTVHQGPAKSSGDGKKFSLGQKLLKGPGSHKRIPGELIGTLTAAQRKNLISQVDKILGLEKKDKGKERDDSSVSYASDILKAYKDVSENGVKYTSQPPGYAPATHGDSGDEDKTPAKRDDKAFAKSARKRREERVTGEKRRKERATKIARERKT